MLQELPETTWDLRTIGHPLSASLRIYILFLFVVCIVACIKLVRVWRGALPFRLHHQAKNPNYLELLQASAVSLKQWISCVFLGWGFVVSISLSEDCDRLLASKGTGSFLVLYFIQELSSLLTMTLLVVLFVFLVRWHIVNRIEHLRHS